MFVPGTWEGGVANWLVERLTKLGGALAAVISWLAVAALVVAGAFGLVWLAGKGLGLVEAPLDRVREMAAGEAGDGGPETLGGIYVESPEVYTRQRLVNDRFAQDAWLRGQLESLDAESARFIDRVVTETFRTGVAASAQAEPTVPAQTGAATGAESAEANVGEGAVEGADATPPAAGPPERLAEPFQVAFELKAAVRDKIRQLVLENSLDDRHDLSGNTVYGLKFDTAVVPGSNTRLRPTVVVKMDIDPFPCEGERDACDAQIVKSIVAGAAGATGEAYGAEFELLSQHFQSWRRNMEFRLNDFLASANSEALVEQRIEEMRGGIEAAMAAYVAENGSAATEFKRCVESGFAVSIDDIPKQIDTAVHHVFGLPEFSVDIRAQLVAKQSLRSIICEIAGYGGDRSGASGRYANVSLKLPSPWDEFFDLSVTTAPWGFGLVPKQRTLLLTRAPIRGETGEEVWPSNFGGRTRCVAAASGATALECRTADMVEGGDFIYVYDRNYDAASQTYGKLLEIGGVEAAALLATAEFEPHCLRRNEGQVEPVPAWFMQGACDGGFDASTVAFDIGLYEFIRRVRDIDVYSYAAFPRGDVSGVVSDVGGSVDLSLGGAAPGAGFASGVSAQNRARAVEARPTILNFAAGEDSGAFFDFGWTIVEEGRVDPMLASQMVLVSVPAYLDKLKLEIWRGWLDSDAGPEREGKTWADYPTLEDRIGLMLRAPEHTTMTVHLPPDYQALDSLVAPAASRLGPLINKEAMSGCVRAADGSRSERLACLRLVSGEAPSIVIPGARLWRSTIVTLGGSQATQITVMPDMRGIIARFAPIETRKAEAGGTSRPTRLDLVVWTSEGTDIMRNYAEVSPTSDWREVSGTAPPSAETSQPVIEPEEAPQTQ